MTDDEIMGKWVAFVGGGTAIRERVLDFAHALEGAFKAEERERCDKIIEEMQGDMPAMLVDMRLVALMFKALRHMVAEND